MTSFNLDFPIPEGSMRATGKERFTSDKRLLLKWKPSQQRVTLFLAALISGVFPEQVCLCLSRLYGTGHSGAARTVPVTPHSLWGRKMTSTSLQVCQGKQEKSLCGAVWTHTHAFFWGSWYADIFCSLSRSPGTRPLEGERKRKSPGFDLWVLLVLPTIFISASPLFKRKESEYWSMAVRAKV